MSVFNTLERPEVYRLLDETGEERRISFRMIVQARDELARGNTAFALELLESAIKGAPPKQAEKFEAWQIEEANRPENFRLEPTQ